MTESVSVIIRTKNEERWIGSCLDAVFNQDYPNFDVVVVDNESTDRTREIVARYHCTVRTISDAEFNFSRALNLGIKASRGTLLAIISGHCIPANEQWLLRLSLDFADPLVAAVYGRQEPLPDSTSFDKRDLYTTFGLDRREQERDYFFHNANSMICRKTWEQIPFSEEIQGVEDRDWAKKALSGGKRIIYEPMARVYHHHGIHHDQSRERVDRVVNVIELIQKDKT
jgi:glycosyltransferase involved in cell wall biosynthesis